MLKKALITVLLASPLAAGASPSVVKVMSHRCGQTRGMKYGSGTLVKERGGVYVITSDHVVYHGDKDQGICHRVLADGKEHPVQLLAANSFKGLALLKPARENARLSELALSMDGKTTESDFAQLAGYPAASRAAIADRNAQVLSSASDRKILPQVSSVVEVKGHSEYGMSGGALLDNGGRYAGLISHQYLRMRLGAPSSLHIREEGSSEKGQELIALVIPGAVVREWMEEAIQGRGNVRFDVAAQLRRSEAMALDGMRFTVKSGCRQQKGPVGGEGAGIGGRGGEGAGIGGSDSTSGGCEILVTLERENATAQTSGITSPWYGQLREKLMAGATARITGTFFQRQRFPVGALIPFFAAIAKGHIPLVEVETPFQTPSFLEQSIAKKTDETRAVLALFPKGTLQGAALDLVTDCEAALEAARLRQWELVDINTLLADTGWQPLMTLDFTKAVDLRSKLLQLAELLRQVRI
ncbi:MAG: trypsin-like peptidase domain-containing protein [Bdellovibrionales bacterium]|nr:trypsin-like peptidase domain-containing protein [Bdellovibrionales bacterium]